MFLPSAILSHTTGSGYTANAVSFYNGGTGFNYLISAALTGVVDGPLGSLSMWCRMDAGDSVTINPKNSTAPAVLVQRTSTNSLLFKVTSSGGLQAQSISNDDVLTGTSWHHILASWDTNHSTAGSKILNFYLDDVNINSTQVNDSAAFNVNYTGENIVFPINNSNSNLALSEIWYAPGQFIDFSNSANRALFSSGGRPISLGATGNLPTGVAPAVYLKNAAATAGTNSGTGGNFTIQGTLANTSGP